MKITLLAFWVLVVGALAVTAQTTVFTYQGRLNTNGIPADGNYDFRFRLLNAASNAVAGPVTNSSIFVTNGIFTTTLNFGGDVFDGSARWLEIGVRNSGTTNVFTVLLPAQALTSTPYAIQAINALNAAAAVVLTAPMNATNLSGTLPDAVLSANVPLQSGGATFSGNVSAPQFNGSGAGLTNLPATNLIGTLPDTRLSTNVPLLNANQNFNGTLTATQFVGNGYGLTNVPGAFFWITVPGNSVNAFPNCGYLATNNAVPLTVTLPTSARVGDIYRVSGVGGAGWIIAQNANQAILSGNLGGGIGRSWTPRDSSRNWQAVASSADGTKLVAVVYGGYIYTSSDSGANWTQQLNGGSGNWYSVASSADGAKLVAAVYGGYIYTSSNSGANWTQQLNSGSGNWYSVASSADGTKLIAANINGIYTSANSGSSWTAHTSVQTCVAVASSADGTKLVVATYGGQLYTSTDSGANWTARDSARNWAAVASSADGNSLVAAVPGTAIYVSVNAGTNWVQSTSSGGLQWGSVASSADGSRLAAVSGGSLQIVGGLVTGNVYTSTDGGITWIMQPPPALSWTSIASSADGLKLVAAAYGDKLYTSSQFSTTVGTNGFLSGGQQTAVEIQYIGNNQFLPLSHEGAIIPH